MKKTPTGYSISAAEIIAAAAHPQPEPRSSRIADMITYDARKGWVVAMPDGEEVACSNMTAALCLAAENVR